MVAASGPAWYSVRDSEVSSVSSCSGVVPGTSPDAVDKRRAVVQERDQLEHHRLRALVLAVVHERLGLDDRSRRGAASRCPGPSTASVLPSARVTATEPLTAW